MSVGRRVRQLDHVHGSRLGTHLSSQTNVSMLTKMTKLVTHVEIIEPFEIGHRPLNREVVLLV